MTLNESLQNRLACLRAALRQAGALLISNPANVRYLTGFTGSAGLVVVTRRQAVFITDPRYGADALGEAGRMYETVILKDAPEKAVRRLCRRLSVKKLAFEKTASYAFYEKLTRVSGADVVPLAGVVEGVRAAKDEYEINCIRGAVRRAEDAFMQIKGFIKPGISENALAARLEEAILRQGSLKPAFPAIVASGVNSAVPHARPTGRKFQPGDLVVIDWGAEYEGYCSDMTRTFLIRGPRGAPFGKDPRLAEKRRIYRIVLEAQEAAINFVKRVYGKAGGDGKGPKVIDNEARYVIKQAGYGEYFGHSLGHGVGLEVHEQPAISPHRGGNRPLAPKTVFTVEPGIYVPGLGGVRIEDMVYLAEGRPEVLTHLPKAGI
ncbi:MAG: Xaa-Pro peptidase family protein [Nitrospiraceae bacterium]|nr:Xaa-Pro peptidase family protein [Nitrospiraceae bacterium]